MKHKTLAELIPVPDDDMLLVNSSIADITAFMKSALYQDYLRELAIRISLIDAALYDPDLEFTGRHYDLFRGVKQNLLDSKDLFINMLNALKDAENEGEE